jgi:hypothetical protein
MLRVIRFASVFLFLFAACKEVDNQKPKDAFKDGKFPKYLFELANQQHELRGHMPVLRGHLEQVYKSKDHWVVSVGDEGVDFTHPDLIKKIYFRYANGNVTGAGLDLMGDDDWASPNLVNPELFAFGSGGVEQGRIVNAPANPLEVLAKMNSDFMKGLTEKIRQHPQLKDSLFNKITEEAMTVIGARYLLDEETPMKFSEKAYKEKKERDELITPDIRERLAKIEISNEGDDSKKTDEQKRKENFKKSVSSLELYYLLDRPWRASWENGVPRFEPDINEGSYGFELHGIEHADRFFALLRSHFDEFQTRSGFKAAYENYQEYLKNGRVFDSGDDAEKIMRETVKRLSHALRFKKYGPKIGDPLFELNVELETLVAREKLTGDEAVAKPFAMTQAMMTEALDSALRRYERALQFYASLPNLDYKEKRKIRKLEDNLGDFKEVVTWFRAERSLNTTSLLGPEAKGTPQESVYRRRLWRTSHPFLAETSSTAGHGTFVADIVAGNHLSGIINKNNNKILVKPVRISLGESQASNFTKEELKAKFTKDFQVWLADPVVHRAIGDKFAGVFPNVKFDSTKPNVRQKISSLLMDLLKEKIDISFESSPSIYVSLNEIEKFVRNAAEDKNPVANMSLGAKAEIPASSPSIKEPLEQLEDFYNFLLFEFYKYRTGQALKEAKNTLFVISTGNSGQWFNGTTRSAFPVDPSSPFLAKHEDPSKGEIAPNNHVNNIIGSGSLTPDHDISAFTNVPLLEQIPFLLVRGEAIRSGVRPIDMEGAEQLWDEIFPEHKNLLSLLDLNDRFKALFEQSPEVQKEKDPDKREEALLKEKLRYYVALNVVRHLIEGAKMHFCLKYPAIRAMGNGTSFSSPITVRIISDIAVEKAEREGLLLGDAYGRPGYLPEDLKKAVFAKAKRLNEGARGIGLYAITGELVQEEDPQALAGRKFLGEIIAKGKIRQDKIDAEKAMHKSVPKEKASGAGGDAKRPEAAAAAPSPCDKALMEKPK